MIIRLKVFEQTLSIVDTKSVPRKGSKDYLVLQFMFSSDWKDLNKLCYLQKGEVSQPIDVVNNIVKVPEWFTQQDHFYITLFGKNDNQEVPTNVVPLRLDKSNTLWEKDAPEPQPSWIVKLIDLNNHPPVPGNNGYWMLWDTDKGTYVESELPLPAGGGVALDTTLSEAGKAADAKAVGDALAEIEVGGIYEETDPTVPEWAKAATKPSYTAAEVGAMAADASVVKTVNGTAPDASGNVTVEAGGSGGDAVVTAEKAYAASVLELADVATNQYVAQHDSVLFEATEDTVLSVGSDNMVSSAPVSTSVNGVLAPTIIVTEVEGGYKYELNPDYTGTNHFQNYRVYFAVNIQNGKTYTLAFKADGDFYLYLSADTAQTGTLIGGLIPTVDGKKVLTFTATADYGYARITPTTLPRTLTEITLCEGDVALEYGGGAGTYSLSAGEKMWLSGVKGLNCMGAGNFYESPLAVTSFNGVATSTGAVKSCATKKTWVNMGDSLWTFGASVGGIGTITDYMVALCGGTWHNIATGGTTMASRPGSYAGTHDALDFWQLADAIVAGDYTDAKAAAAELTSNFANIDNVDWFSVDYVTVAYGTNDLAFGAAIDSESNPLDTATICGALRYGIKTINGKYPNIRFKVLGVVYRSDDAVTPAKIVECNEALRAAAAYVGAEFVDGYGINAGNSGTFLYDGTHPNANGKVRIAETLARSIHEVWYD